MEAAKCFAYDLILPDVLEQLGHGGYAVQTSYHMVSDARHVTSDARDSALRILDRQMASMSIGVLCNPKPQAAAARWYPLLRGILEATNMEQLMPAIVRWALEDTGAHARFLFRLYEDMFYLKKSQDFPSTRQTPPDYSSTREEARWAARLPRDPEVLRTIALRERFVVEVWLPYAMQHSALWGAMVNELQNRGSSSAYHPLFHAVGLSPVAHFDGRQIHYDFSVGNSQNFKRGC